MPNLSDFFSDEFKQNFALQNITIGSVLRCFVKNTNPPKEKRFVVLGFDNNGNLVGTVFINTEINWKVNRTMELAQLQLYVRAEDNDYLDWDSYIDCSELVEIPKNEIATAISTNPANVLGTVNNEDFTSIIEYVKKSPKNPPKLLKKYKI